MTLFGVDLSNNNWRSASEIPAFLAQEIAEGFSWIEHKVSEGSYYADPYWPAVRNWCAANDFPCIGYHYVTTNDAAAQVAKYIGNGGTSPVMLDFEANSGGIENFWAVVNAFNARGIAVALSYIPRWYWYGTMGSPSLAGVPGLVSSSYYERGTYASVEYADAGGDSGAGWASYGGATPVIWQFSDAGIVAGKSVDVNAFKGTINDLRALLGGTPQGGITMSDAQSILNNEQGVDQNGTPQWWNVVYGRARTVFGALIGNPQKGPWNEPYPAGVTQLTDSAGNVLPPGGVWDHGAHDVLAAEAVSWRYVDSTGLEVDDQSIQMALWEYLRAKDPAGLDAAIAAASIRR